MKVSYWPDFRCDEESRQLCHPSTVHIHCETDEEAARALLEGSERVAEAFQGVIGGPLTGPPRVRYRCITGPDGLILRNVHV